MSNIDIVRESLDAYQRQDFELASKPLADERYRNTEYITLRSGQLVETQVFFGGRV